MSCGFKPPKVVGNEKVENLGNFSFFYSHHEIMFLLV